MNVRFCFSAEQLKNIALVSMVIDHAAVGLIEQSELASGVAWSLCGTAMRLMGRVAFPLFAFMIAEGAVHTRDRRWYALRLLLLAVISEIPFDLVAGGTWLFPADQNTVFTLLLGLLAVWVGDLICGSGSGVSYGNRKKTGDGGRKAVGQRRFPLEYERYIRVLAAVPFGLAAYCLIMGLWACCWSLFCIHCAQNHSFARLSALCFYFVCIWISMALRLALQFF